MGGWVFACVHVCVSVHVWLSVFMCPRVIGASLTLVRTMVQVSCVYNSLHINKSWVITYKCFRMCVHYANNYQSSFVDTPYKAGMYIHHKEFPE